MLADIGTLRRRAAERTSTPANAANAANPREPLAGLATLATTERLTAAIHRLCDLRRDDDEHCRLLLADCRSLELEGQTELLATFLADIERLEARPRPYHSETVLDRAGEMR